MAAKGGDALTQIQKYKAMLSSKRNQSGEKAIRRPKKKRARKEDVKTGLETVLGVPGLAETKDDDLSKEEAKNLKEENFDSTNVEATTVLSQETKESPELLNTNDGERSGERVEQESTITSLDENEPKGEESTGKSAEDKQSPATDEKEQQKKEKSKGLSIRRKRKKTKKKHKETEDKPQSVKNEGEIEEIHGEKKESGSELDEGSVVPFSSPETILDESQASQENGEENNSKEGAEDKDKESRAQKFKRWASFTKQKKTSDSLAIEDESFELENSGKSTNQNSDSVEEVATDGHLNDDSLQGSKEGQAEEETVDHLEDSECPPLPEKQRRRSGSLIESTEKESVAVSPDDVQTTRTSRSGKKTILGSLTASLRPEKSRKKTQENKGSRISNGDQENETEGDKACSHKDETIPDLVVEIENNENANEVESDQALEEKTTKSIVGDDKQSFDATATDDVNTELDEIETAVKEEQPKKKKKSFLRKLSSRGLKTKKGEETRELKKSDISAPLLIKAKDQSGSQEASCSPEEVSPEKLSKRKKSALNLKFSKGLKRIKSSEYVAITGAEAEKEIEKDETLTTKENIKKKEGIVITEGEDVFQSVGEVQPSVEKELTESNLDELEYYREDNVEDKEVYALCRGLMNDVIKELTDNLTKLEQLVSEDNNSRGVRNDDSQTGKGETDTLSSIVEEMNSLEENSEFNEFENEEDGYYNVDDSSALADGSNEIVEGKSEQQFVSETEEEETDKAKANSEQDISAQEANEENEANTESIEIEKISQTVQEHLELEPKQPEDMRFEDELKKPKDIPTQYKDGLNQTEATPMGPEGETKQPNDTFQPEQHCDGEAMESEDTLTLYDSKEGGALVRSIEVSMKTQALIDSYILISDSFQLSQSYLNQVQIMEFTTKRKPRCSVM